MAKKSGQHLWQNDITFFLYAISFVFTLYSFNRLRFFVFFPPHSVGDIALLNCTAVVNTSNESLNDKNPTSDSIHQLAGPELRDELLKLKGRHGWLNCWNELDFTLVFSEISLGVLNITSHPISRWHYRWHSNTEWTFIKSLQLLKVLITHK